MSWLLLVIDIHFLKPLNSYLSKTPDITMNGVEWEIKSPTSSEKTTIRNILQKATKQSSNIILDTMRTNTVDETVICQVKTYLSKHKSIKKFVLITKTRKIVVLKGKLW